MPAGNGEAVAYELTLRMRMSMRMSISMHGCEPIFIIIERGVKQGCPISGTLFALAIDPVLRWVASALLRQLGVPGAFADDLGVGAGDVFEALLGLLSPWDSSYFLSGITFWSWSELLPITDHLTASHSRQ